MYSEILCYFVVLFLLFFTVTIHKVCVGQNKLVISLLEGLDWNLILKEGQGQILYMHIPTCVAIINHEKFMVYSHFIF
jgi:hypothetical protein